MKFKKALAWLTMSLMLSVIPVQTTITYSGLTLNANSVEALQTSTDAERAVINAIINAGDEEEANIDITDLVKEKSWEDLNANQDKIKNWIGSTVNLDKKMWYRLGGFNCYVKKQDEKYYLELKKSDFMLTNQEQQEVVAAVDRFVQTIPEGYSTEAKLLFIQEKFKDMAPYDYDLYEKYKNNPELSREESKSFTAYGVFISKRAVCDGYSKAFMMVADRLGIETRYLQSIEGSHAWNAVKLNGKWYNYDITQSEIALTNGNLDTTHTFLRSDDFYKSLTSKNGTLDTNISFQNHPIDDTGLLDAVLTEQDRDQYPFKVGKVEFSKTNNIYFVRNPRLKRVDSKLYTLPYPQGIAVAQLDQTGALTPTELENVAYADLANDIVVTVDVENKKLKVYDKNHLIKNNNPIEYEVPELESVGTMTIDTSNTIQIPNLKIVNLDSSKIPYKITLAKIDNDKLNTEHKAFYNEDDTLILNNRTDTEEALATITINKPELLQVVIDTDNKKVGDKLTLTADEPIEVQATGATVQAEGEGSTKYIVTINEANVNVTITKKIVVPQTETQTQNPETQNTETQNTETQANSSQQENTQESGQQTPVEPQTGGESQESGQQTQAQPQTGAESQESGQQPPVQQPPVQLQPEQIQQVQPQHINKQDSSTFQTPVHQGATDSTNTSSRGSSGGGGGGSSSSSNNKQEEKTVIPKEETTVAKQENTQSTPQQIQQEQNTISNYKDIQENSWYAQAVDYVVKNNLMTGTTKTNFATNKNTTRAMIVTILHRLSKDSSENQNALKDVQNGKWYTNAVAWATTNNIIKGYEGNIFKPNQDVTREQLITILYNYAKARGYDVTTSKVLTNFKDDSKVSEYAQEPMKWAVENELITGINGNLLPRGMTTRAQLAVIIEKFVEKFYK